MSQSLAGARGCIADTKCPLRYAVARIQPTARLCSKPGAAARAPLRGVAAQALSDEQYDYIIVGGGTGGCLLANRLSADPSKKVLVLEAGGGNDQLEVQAPVGLTRLFNHATLNWNIESTKQKAVGGRELYLSRGKLLGGSSSVNATLYHRGTAQDYDNWGLDGWRSQDVLPWFVAAEDNPSMTGSRFHAVGGGMHVERPIYQNTLFDSHFQASEQFGLEANPDFNDWSRPQEGFGDFQVAITNRGRRADAYRQYLKPVLGRGNLKVVTQAQTTKVHIDKVSGKPTAVGVEIQMLKDGRPTGSRESVRVAEGGEVLMAAGAVHTPQILMLSGVGDRKHLQQHGIECHSDLNGVGMNLQDHPAALSAFALKEGVATCHTDEIYNDKGDIRATALADWALFGKGPLTTTGCDRGAFLRTDPSLKQPDVQLRYVASLALNADAIKSYTEFGLLKAQGKVARWPQGITFQVLACRPKSRGTVSLASGSISDKPVVNLGYCTDAAGADRRSLREGLRVTRKLAAQAAWQGKLREEVHPGADVQSDAQLDEFLDRTMHSGNALVGTCAMGVNPTSGSVVSSKDLRVHGVNGLRIVDASVLPAIPGGQTGAPVVMIAERAASMMIQREASVTAARVLATASA